MQSVPDPADIGCLGLKPTEHLRWLSVRAGARSSRSNWRSRVRSDRDQPEWARRIRVTCAAVRSGRSR